MGQLAAHINIFDPNHKYTTGYSKPRSTPWHLTSSPEWSGADWTQDSVAEMGQYIALTHPDPLDLVSIHLYPDGDRLGLDGRDPRLIGRYQDAADAIGKPLFIGEFGDTNPTVSELRSANFTRRCLLETLTRRVPLSLIWVWEFYQFAPDAPSTHSIEPGVDDDLIGMYSEIDTWLGAASTDRGLALAVPNYSMEADVDSDQLADGWESTWRDGSSTGWLAEQRVNAADAFEDDAFLRLDSGAGDAASFVYARSDSIAVSGGEDVVLSAAIRRHLNGSQRARLSLVELDGSDSELRATLLELDDALGWVYRVEYQRQQLLAATRAVRIRVAAGGADNTIVDFDDVRLFQVR